ncbi:MAG: hypothetical protein RLZZ237_2984 [Pseudomonadota bacterium]|jgi:hypothetical protein
MSIPTSTFISAVSALIAAFATLIAVRNLRREQLNQKISSAKWKKEYFSDLMKWSDEAMLQLSEAMHLCELDPKRMEGSKFFDLRHSLRIRLSAQIDRGRWFFPNYAIADYGQDKPEGFRGFRHEVLDGLVFVYKELCNLDEANVSNNQERRKIIKQAKRLFTGEVQKILDPRSRDEEFQKLLEIVSGD